MNFTQEQLNALATCADLRCIEIKEKIKQLVNDYDFDVAMVAVYTKEYADLQGAIMQLAMAGAKIGL